VGKIFAGIVNHTLISTSKMICIKTERFGLNLHTLNA